VSDAESHGRRDALFAEAVDTFGPALERLARGYERDADRRRDLLQEIHVALWRSFSGFNGRCSLRTWVYRVAHNTATSVAIRRQARMPTLLGLDEGPELVAEGHDHDAVLDRRLALDRLYELIERLKPLDRQVMLLYLEDVDAASIAEISGLSAANVATKVRRLKQLLTRQFHEGDRHAE
jgi:RNA polymerase sigma-70 factor (ECF subfamily)